MDFEHQKALYKQKKFNELTTTNEGRRFLKLKSFDRPQYLENFLEKKGISFKKLKKKEYLKTAFDLDIKVPEIDLFIKSQYKIERDLRKKEEENLFLELNKLESFDWGGFNNGDLEGGIITNYINKIDSYDLIKKKISDELNHASIIDGVRLCKAQRFRYKNCDMQDLETQLKNSMHLRHRLIVTDGVFSMDGFVAPLDAICDLADRYKALVMVDECHATGFIGKTGRGTIEAKNVMGRVDIITGTLGKALGGAMGGFTSGRKEIIELLRQRSRPYLFSNSLAPSIVGASLAVFDLLSKTTALRDKNRKTRDLFQKTRNRFLPLRHRLLPG